MTSAPPKEHLAIRVGQAVRERRLALGLKLEDLSRLSGVGIATLSHLENGNRDLRLSTLEKTLQALRCEVEDLLVPTKSKEDHVPEQRSDAYDLEL